MDTGRIFTATFKFICPPPSPAAYCRLCLSRNYGCCGIHLHAATRRLSSNAFGIGIGDQCILLVTLRRTRLVLGWVNVCGLPSAVSLAITSTYDTIRYDMIEEFNVG